MWRDATHNLQSELAGLNRLLSFAPPWAVSLIIVIVALIAAWLLHAAILVALRRLLGNRQPYLRTILDATNDPTRLAFLIAALAIALPTAPVDADTESVLGKVLTLATICLVGWIALTALQIAANLYLLRFHLDVEDNLLARKHVTRVRVLVRALDTVIILLTLGIAGVQLAVTQPIRLEDAVTVQNEYGWIEEINATYVVIRL